jgi:hypothetical protein
MEFKGWNVDLENSTWFKAVNFKLNTRAKRLLIEGIDEKILVNNIFIPYLTNAQLCGDIELPNSHIFFFKNPTIDFILEVRDESLNELTLITTSNYFNFSTDRWIKGLYTTNSENERVIIFWEAINEDANEPKILNIDSCPDVFTEETMNSILFSPISLATNIKSTSLVSGSLPTGKYSISFSYDFKIGIGNAIHWSNPIMLYNYKDIEDLETTYCDKSGTNSTNALSVDIVEADTILKKVYINIAIYENSELVVYRSKESLDISNKSNIIIGDLYSYEKIDNSVFIENAQFKGFQDATITKDRLAIGSYQLKNKTYDTLTDVDLQNIANNLKIIFYKEYASDTNFYNPTGEHKSLMFGEVYDIKIRFWFGSNKSKIYHIPGQNPSSENQQLFNSDIEIDNKFYPYYTVRDTTYRKPGMTGVYSGYYPNKQLKYPKGFGTVEGDTVKFHKTPTIDSLSYPLSFLTNNQLLRLGLQLEGDINVEGLTHYELFYTKRNITNSNCILIDFFNGETNTIKGKTLLSSSHLDLLKNNDLVNIKPKLLQIFHKWDLQILDKGSTESIIIDDQSGSTLIEHNVIKDRVYGLSDKDKIFEEFNIQESRYAIKGGNYDNFKYLGFNSVIGNYEIDYPISVNPYLHSQTRFVFSAIDDERFKTLVGENPEYYSNYHPDNDTLDIVRIGGASTTNVYEGVLLNCNSAPYSNYLDCDVVSTGFLKTVDDRSTIFNFDVCFGKTGIRATKAQSVWFVRNPGGSKKVIVRSLVGLARYYNLPYYGISNPAYRTKGSIITQEVFYPYSKVSLDGIDGSPLNSQSSIPNWNGYNEDANLFYPTTKTIYNPAETYIYDNKYGIYFSDVQNPESKNIGFRNFKPLNYIESSRSLGAIIGIVNTSSELIVLQEFGITKAKTQVQLNSQEGLVQIAPINFSDLELEQIIESRSGAVGIDKFTDYCITDIGLFIFTLREKSIYLYNGKLINISKIGLENLYLYLLNTSDFNPSFGLSRYMTYDREYRRMIFHIRNSDNYFIGSFDLDNLIWISEHNIEDSIYIYPIGSKLYFVKQLESISFWKVGTSNIAKSGEVIFSFIYDKPVKLTSLIGRIINTLNNTDECPIPYSVQIITRQGISEEVILTSKNYYTKNYTTHNGEFYIKNFNNILKQNTPNIIGLNGEILEIKPNLIEEKWYNKRAFKAQEILVKLKFNDGEFIAVENLKLLN